MSGPSEAIFSRLSVCYHYLFYHIKMKKNCYFNGIKRRDFYIPVFAFFATFIFPRNKKISNIPALIASLSRYDF